MRHNKRKWGLILYLPLWLLITAMSLGLLIIQASRYRGYHQELDSVTAELTREQKIFTDLQDQIVYYDSDAYVEQIAREQLGLVKPDEIVIVNVAD